MSDQLQIFGSPHLAHGSLALPSVTLALFAYNQQSYVRAAVEGALAQDYDGLLEIILSDDGSTDATFAVMQEVARVYSGPHHVRLNRNKTNLGLSAHVNHVLAMAQGEIIVIAAGDDISLPSRVQDTVAAFARHPEVTAVSFEDIYIDDSGVPFDVRSPSMKERIVDLDAFLTAGPRAQTLLRLSGASRGFRRTVYERFGNLMVNCPAEDTPYLRRALYLGSCLRCGWPAIQYRIHTRQLSKPANICTMKAQIFTDQYLADFAKLSELGLSKGLPLARIRAHIEAEAIAFRLRGLQQADQSPDLHLVIRMILAKGFSAREKLGLAKRFLMQKGLS